VLTLAVSADTPDPAVIGRAADILRAGGIVAYPTDTFYGLAIDPRSDAAVARLFDAKGREAGAAIPLIAASVEQVREAADVSDRELKLARAFWPGPLTIVLRPRPGLSIDVLGGGPTVAVRVPAHPVARALAGGFGFCITSTSANRSGQPPAITADDVRGTLGMAVDLLLDGGPAPGGLPSTIVELTPDGPLQVRAGAVPWERVLESLE
jgi:L-threonylcarbamoyladenylate synthase